MFDNMPFWGFWNHFRYLKKKIKKLMGCVSWHLKAFLYHLLPWCYTNCSSAPQKGCGNEKKHNKHSIWKKKVCLMWSASKHTKMHNYEMLRRMQNFTSHFFHHKIMKWLILWCKLYQDPSTGKIIANSVITLTPIAFIHATYCLFSMFYRFIQTIEYLLNQLYIEGVRIL